MFWLPIQIKKYKTAISPEDFVKRIRQNTIYQYNKNDFIKGNNFNDKLFRNEKDKAIYLKRLKDLNTRYGGGTTAVFVSEEIKGETIITAISYYGWQQLIVIGLLLIAIIYLGIFNQAELLTIIIGLGVFNLLFAIFSSEALKQQRDLIESLLD